MKSLLLDRTTWDLSLDANRDLAVCTEPYSVLQDVATAVRTWLGECWYDTSLGLPFDSGIFDGSSSLPLLRAQAESAAMSVPGVAAAQCALIGPREDRSIGGAIAITLTTGETQSVQF
ncbi:MULTISPECIES: hypothetical protein [Gluconobacter]|uniref:Uncharacterized protein n=3 Tax=Gluconobacter TaxID=441 RepID=A0AB34XKP2_GLUOY|nr:MULTISPECIES: hypothetical protein [Gluconobacter]AHK72189.1 hypothetical protein GLS_c23180 [Gluconobacter oxydans DSM 3504]KXV10001.1 hypothetical protein AD931_02345 [Gluconobacter oxydans]MBF0851068.1 hypothetical protein [Gluconobacter sp. R75690]MBF0865131.1 hypothetical protein [Gluconobacter sp. R71656]MBF0868359.1 hypothetical protein [Gluconobacter sp. R75628]